MTRRQLLRILAQTGIGVPLAQALPFQSAFARDPLIITGGQLPPIENRKIIFIRMFGGNDGLNTVVPYQDPLYYHMRQEQSIVPCAIHPHEVLVLPDHPSLGFHPALSGLYELYKEGKVAVLQNVGYPHQDLSHFHSTDIWLTANISGRMEYSGWMGRYLETRYNGIIPPYPPAIELGSSLSRFLLGRSQDMGFAYNGNVDIPEKMTNNSSHISSSRIEQNYINEIRNASHTFLKSIQNVVEKNIKNTRQYNSRNRIAVELSTVAQLIAGGLQTPVYSIITDLLFDNHEYLLYLQHRSLSEVMGVVYEFQRDCEQLGIADEILIVLYSEFGRRVRPNGSGTDHGAAAPVFIIGNNVHGGVYGENPQLSNLDDEGNIRFVYDFRQIYSTLLTDWFGALGLSLYPNVLSTFTENIPFLYKNSELQQPLLFPNPCMGELNVTLDSERINSLEIYSCFGEKCIVTYQNMGMFGCKVMTQHLASGHYVVRLNTAHSTYESLFVKI
ncbi:MAG: DUF1501 domain-containing protein [Candidatus Kapaibacterium sp.]|jgi:uncharacterized protein (DUF1501 family)